MLRLPIANNKSKIGNNKLIKSPRVPRGSRFLALGIGIFSVVKEPFSGLDAQVAGAVNCEPGHPMLRVDRLYSDLTGSPVELSVSHFLPEQYTYRVTLRRSG